jgi:hypothetical protein
MSLNRMEENNQPEISSEQGNRRSSLLGEGLFPLLKSADLFDPGCPLSLKSVLWLDFFLHTGPEDFKEKWLCLSPSDQDLLGIIFLRAYLYQPLFITISDERQGSGAWKATASEKKGGLLQVVFDSEGKKGHKIYYPLEHARLWPDLLPVLMANFIPSPGAQKSLERELTITSTSRLDYIQLRAKTLETFLSNIAIPVLPPDQVTTADPLAHEGLKRNFEEQDFEAKSPASEGNTPWRSPDERELSREAAKVQAPKKKKKRSKPDQDQMKLF